LAPGLSDPADPEWTALWRAAVGDGRGHRFAEAFDALPPERQVELVRDSFPFNVALAARVQDLGVAEKLRDLLVHHPKNEEAAKALYAQGEVAVPVLTEMLDGKDAAVRLVAVTAVGRLSGWDQAPLLLRGLVDGRREVRSMAASALRACPAEAIESRLTQLLATGKKVEKEAVVGLLRMRRDALTNRLLPSEEAPIPREQTGRLAELIAALDQAVDSRRGHTLLDDGTFESRLAADPTATTADLVNLALSFPQWRYQENPIVAPEALAEAFGKVRAVDAELADLGLALAVCRMVGHWAVRTLLEAARPTGPFVDALPVLLSGKRTSWPVLARWVAVNCPSALGPMLVVAEDLPDVSASVAQDILALSGRVDLAEEQLGARLAGTRKGAVRVLLSIGGKDALAALRARLPLEKTKSVRALLLAALATDVDAAALSRDHPDAASLDAALSSLPAPELPKGIDTLTALRWSDGTLVSEAARAWWVGAVCAQTEVSPGLLTLSERLDRETTAALHTHLLEQANDPRWLPMSAGVFGNPMQREALAKTLDDAIRKGRQVRVAEALDMLAVVADGGALRWLDHWRRRAKSNALSEHCEQRLDRLCEERQTTRSDLLADAIPTLGFDAQGTLAFRSGTRTFTLTVAADGLTLALNGKFYKALPGARKDEDAAEVKAAKARYRRIRDEVTGFVELASDCLERRMASGQTWTATEWRAFVARPLVAPVSRRVVFEQPGARFVWTGSEALDANGSPVSVVGPVGVAHPLDGELFDFEDQVGVQPFEQIDRATYGAEELAELVGSRAPIDSRVLLSVLGRRGWRRGEVLDGGMVGDVHRSLGTHRVSLVHSGHYIGESDEVRLVGLELNGLPDLSVLTEREASELGADLASLP
jgi:hypothetical protein